MFSLEQEINNGFMLQIKLVTYIAGAWKWHVIFEAEMSSSAFASALIVLTEISIYVISK